MRCALVIALLVLAAPNRADQAGKDPTLHEQLLGAWQSVQILEGGKKVEINLKIVFTPTEAHLYENGERKKDEDAAWVIDAKKNPATIDLNPKKKGAKKELGILKIDKDALTICVVEEGNAPRPGEFRSAPDSKVVLLQFKRVKQ